VDPRASTLAVDVPDEQRVSEISSDRWSAQSLHGDGGEGAGSDETAQSTENGHHSVMMRAEGLARSLIYFSEARNAYPCF
jgi:hypothetical protein